MPPGTRDGKHKIQQIKLRSTHQRHPEWTCVHSHSYCVIFSPSRGWHSEYSRNMTALSDFEFGFISPGYCIYLVLYECHTSEPTCHENKILLDFLLSAFSMNSIKTIRHRIWSTGASAGIIFTCRTFSSVTFCYCLREQRRVELSIARNSISFKSWAKRIGLYVHAHICTYTYMCTYV